MAWDSIKDTIMKTAVGTFGVDVTYTPDGEDAVEIKGVFTRDYAQIPTGGGTPVSGFRSVLDIRLADLGDAEANQGDTLTIGDDSFEVTDVQEDGGAGARLILRKTT